MSPYTESLASSTHLPISSPNYSTSPSYSPSSHQQNYTIKSSHHHHPYYTSYRQYSENQGNVQEPISPELLTSSNLEGQEKAYGSSLNVNTSSSSPQLSPVFKSEAARQIIKEMTEKKVEGPRRRQIPREKRRHYTVSSSKPILDLEDTFSKMVSFLSFSFLFSYFLLIFLLVFLSFFLIVIPNSLVSLSFLCRFHFSNFVVYCGVAFSCFIVASVKCVRLYEGFFCNVAQGMGRARDDLDMERALRPRINAPDVVRSTLSHKELKYNESTIDQLLGTPNKIVIPERYIPEQVR